jgi:hypothetical protein
MIGTDEDVTREKGELIKKVETVVMPEEDFWKFEFDKERFERERRLWTEQNILSYHFNMQYMHFWESYDGTAFHVIEDFNNHLHTVENGILTERQVLQGIYPLAFEDKGIYWNIFCARGEAVLTIDDLFAHLEKEIADIRRRAEGGSNEYGIVGAKIEIAYHPDYHFPVSWEFTYYDNVERMIERTTTTTADGTDVTKEYLSVEIKSQTIDKYWDTQILDFQPLD